MWKKLKGWLISFTAGMGAAALVFIFGRSRKSDGSRTTELFNGANTEGQRRAESLRRELVRQREVAAAERREIDQERAELDREGNIIRSDGEGLSKATEHLSNAERALDILRRRAGEGIKR